MLKRPLTSLVLLVLLLSGCRGYAPQVIKAIEDCITLERPAITALITKWTSEKPTLREIETEAIAKGSHIGGCAVHEFVQIFLTPAPGNRAPSPDEGWAALALVDSFDVKMKTTATTFHTPSGDI